MAAAAVAKSTWPLYVPRFASHALEMARGAGVSIILDTGKIPVMEEAWSLATEGIVPGGAYRNLAVFGSALQFNGHLSTDHQLIYTDPQTSSGLLMAVATAIKMLYGLFTA